MQVVVVVLCGECEYNVVFCLLGPGSLMVAPLIHILQPSSLRILLIDRPFGLVLILADIACVVWFSLILLLDLVLGRYSAVLA
jgi:hypothetical protein